MWNPVWSLLLLPVVFVAMLFLLKAGYQIGKRRLADETEQERVGLVSIETAIFGLLGLLFAFTYAGAASRFEQRRALTIQESNAIGTTYLRLDLLPAAAQPPMRDKMRRYAQARLDAYDGLPDVATFTKKIAESKVLQGEIWSGVIAALRDSPPTSTQLLIPALNDMIDITSTREAMLQVHTPGAVLAALVVLACFCSVLAGYGLAGSKTWSRYLHMIGFATIIVGIIFIVLDYDYPRIGLITLDYADQALRETIAGMK